MVQPLMVYNFDSIKLSHHGHVICFLKNRVSFRCKGRGLLLVIMMGKIILGKECHLRYSCFSLPIILLCIKIAAQYILPHCMFSLVWSAKYAHVHLTLSLACLLSTNRSWFMFLLAIFFSYNTRCHSLSSTCDRLIFVWLLKHLSAVVLLSLSLIGC